MFSCLGLTSFGCSLVGFGGFLAMCDTRVISSISSSSTGLIFLTDFGSFFTGFYTLISFSLIATPYVAVGFLLFGEIKLFIS
jgi:hypothetical protein